MEVFEEMNCSDCSYFFTEWDDMERRQIGYCCYKSNVTGLMMDMAEKGFKCPLKELKELKMDDHIIIIGDSNGFDGWRWKMTIDLKELAEATGRKDKKFKCIEIPLNRAKKLLKLIRQHCSREEDLQKVDKWMAKNPKLALYWGPIR